MNLTSLEGLDVRAMLEALERLVKAESPSLDKALCDRCADLVLELFADHPAARMVRHRRESAGDHLVIHLGEGPQPVLLLLHYDTVWPQGTLARLPFRVDGDRVQGPGTYDMKAGIVEAAFALKRTRPRRPVVALATSDEEVGSQSSRELIEGLGRQAAAVLVLEPATTGGAIKTARKGVADFTLRVEGRAAHAGVEPEKGVSAIDELARQVLRVRALADPGKGTTVNVGVISGGTRPNVVAAHAEAKIDVRIASAAEAERIVGAIHGLRPENAGARLWVEGGMDRPPMERTEGVARLAAIAQSLAGELGFELPESSTGGASDGNFTAALGIPTLDGLGPDGGGAHADSEHFLVGSWLARTKLLCRLLETL
jgi:glutamate carboxypeptidase